jgi:hypothetical protein
MQIHEITHAHLREGILGTVGQDIKRAVTAPVEKFKALSDMPGGFTDPGAAATAMDKYYRGEVERNQAAFDQQRQARVVQQTQQKAKELAQQWGEYLKSKKPSDRLKSTPTPLKPTGQYSKKPTGTTTIDMKTGKPMDQAVSVQEQAGGPTPAELAKYQEKLAAASQTKSGFGALPGQTPPPGGTVKPQSTRTIMTGARAQEFRDWANKQLASRVTGTNQTLTLDQVRKADPAAAQQLAQLLPAILMKNDPQATEQYFTIAMQAMQRLSAQIRQSQKSTRTTASTVSPLSMILNPGQIEDLQKMFQDPVKGSAAKRTLGIK